MFRRFLWVSYLVTRIGWARQREFPGHKIPCACSFFSSDSVNAESFTPYLRDGRATGWRGTKRGTLLLLLWPHRFHAEARRVPQALDWVPSYVKATRRCSRLKFFPRKTSQHKILITLNWTFPYTVPLSAISVEQWSRTDSFNQSTAIETSLEDRWNGRCSVFTVSSFIRIKDLPTNRRHQRKNSLHLTFWKRLVCKAAIGPKHFDKLSPIPARNPSLHGKPGPTWTLLVFVTLLTSSEKTCLVFADYKCWITLTFDTSDVGPRGCRCGDPWWNAPEVNRQIQSLQKTLANGMRQFSIAACSTSHFQPRKTTTSLRKVFIQCFHPFAEVGPLVSASWISSCCTVLVD